jgi:uncharacterized protein YuzE
MLLSRNRAQSTTCASVDYAADGSVVGIEFIGAKAASTFARSVMPHQVQDLVRGFGFPVYV